MNPFSWLDERLGLSDSLAERLDFKVAPNGISFARAMTVAFVSAIVIAMVTGIGLSTVYSPSSSSAWASVYFTEFVLPVGWYVRSTHVIATESSMVLGLIAVVAAAFERTYQYKRELAFWALAAGVGLVFVAATTGNALRWDNRGYFGLLVESSIIGGVPVVGSLVRSLLLGGSSLGNWTLTRLFSLHAIVLPAVFVLLAWLARNNTTKSLREHDLGEARPYRERQIFLDTGAALFVAALVAILGSRFPAPLEAPADPLGSYAARPEVYFQGLYVARSVIPLKLQGAFFALVPVLAAAPVALLPLIDKAGSKISIVFSSLMVVGLLGMTGLTVAGVMHDKHDEELQVARAKDAKLNKRSLQIARQGVPPAGALEMLKNDPILRAESLYSEHCASCHRLGDLGPPKGKDTAPVLDNWGTEAWVMELLDDPDHADKFGKTAFKEKMPSYTKPGKGVDPASFKAMDKADMQAIAKYLAQEAAGNPDPKHDPEGATLIRRRCTSCHLFNGESDDPGGVAPELVGWGGIRWTIAQIANPGTNETYRAASMSKDLEGHMPRFDDKMSPDDVSLLARFVVQRSRKPVK